MTCLRPPSFDQDRRPAAAIFRSPVFNASETFISAQAAGLARYQPLVVGLEDKGHVPSPLAERVMLPRGAGARMAARLGGWRRFAAEIGARDPTLVHAHFATDGLRALPLARLLGVPLIVSLRGYDLGHSRFGMLASGRLSWIQYAIGQDRLMREGDRFLAVSEALRRTAIARGYPAGRVFTLYNGVDLSRFAPPPGTGDGAILHVGRLVEKKGTALLLRAFALARQRRPEAVLTVIGDGPLRRPLERLAGALGQSGSVRFLGYQPPEEVARWMGRSAMLAAPSLRARDGDIEGLPNVAVEAAAAGIPVVASDHQGLPEAVLDGRTGLVVPEGAVEPLADALVRLLASPDLRGRMGAAGRALAEEKFDATRQIGLLEDHYDAVRESGRGRRRDDQRTSTRAIATR
jgi:glycosyltransferase involved in cell wall biosynthesis